MKIDARGLDIKDVLRRLRELLPASCESSEKLLVLTDNRAYAKQIKAFAEMSGCRTETDFRGEDYTVCIAVSSCGCFR